MADCTTVVSENIIHILYLMLMMFHKLIWFSAGKQSQAFYMPGTYPTMEPYSSPLKVLVIVMI